MEKLTEPMTRAWCRAMHRKMYRPANGTYRCQSCLRLYAVPWSEGDRYRETSRLEPALVANKSLATVTRQLWFQTIIHARVWHSAFPTPLAVQQRGAVREGT